MRGPPNPAVLLFRAQSPAVEGVREAWLATATSGLLSGPLRHKLTDRLLPVMRLNKEDLVVNPLAIPSGSQRLLLRVTATRSQGAETLVGFAVREAAQ